jgi:anhydro-N-acetylmuramic acid kinase
VILLPDFLYYKVAAIGVLGEHHPKALRGRDMRSRVAGMMSGTSLDGISLAVIETDVSEQSTLLEYRHLAYSKKQQAFFKAVIKEAYGVLKGFVDSGKLSQKPNKEELEAFLGSRLWMKVLELEQNLTDLHIKSFALLSPGVKTNIKAVGVHGQTIVHFPEISWTWQVIDAKRLAKAVGPVVIYNFRSADLAAGGQGAPLLPIYHRLVLRSAGLALNAYPVGVLNIGGVSNMTLLVSPDKDPIAYDVAFGNGPSDDIVMQALGKQYDEGGSLALRGKPKMALADRVLKFDFFHQKPPKSLDRFQLERVLVEAGIYSLPPTDACASLSLILAKAISMSLAPFPATKTLVVSGGGRHNLAFMRDFQRELKDVHVLSLDQIGGLNGDALEAEGFAYFAACFLQKKTITFPTTTNVRTPVVCGVAEEGSSTLAEPRKL